MNVTVTVMVTTFFISFIFWINNWNSPNTESPTIYVSFLLVETHGQDGFPN